MERTANIRFKHISFSERLKSMIKVDLRRMFTTRLLYIMLAACLVAPILILVMTEMMEGSITVDPQTGKETVMKGFDSVWQMIGSESGSAMSMDLTGMCNINMLYLFIAVLTGLFVSGDFRSGYAKNLFTLRAKKSDYIISKTLVCFIGAALMLLCFFIGSMLGGAISGVSFDLGGVSVVQIVFCMISKVFLALVFTAIDLIVCVAAKQKTWLSVTGSLCAGMLMFTMIPMMTPLNSSPVNVLMCMAGGVIFSAGLGVISSKILSKTSLI